MRRKYYILGALALSLCFSGCGTGGSDTGTTAVSAEAVVPTEAVPTGEAEETTRETVSMTEAVESTQTPETETTEEATEEATEKSTEEPTTAPIPDNEYGWGILADPAYQGPDLKNYFTVNTFPKVDGSTATIPLSEAIFAYTTGTSRMDAGRYIHHTKTSKSYLGLVKGDSDILIVYEPSDEVRAELEKHPVLMKPIGLDALVFMSNANNPVKSLTQDELRQIYKGSIDRWSEVGGVDQKLFAFQRPVGSGSQSLMEKLLMKGEPMEKGDNVYYYDTMDAILEGLLSYNGEDNALGYSVFYYANNMYHLPDLRFMAVDGVMPSCETIYTGEYPLTNAFYAVIRADEPEDSNAHKLFDWLTSDEAQKITIEEGYVPVIKPEGVDFGGEIHYAKDQVEIFAKEPLKDGSYYIMFSKIDPDNYQSLGNVVVFNKNWEKIVSFYNARLARTEVYDCPRLYVEQARRDPDGRERTYYGVYDLEQQKYVIGPQPEQFYCINLEKNIYLQFDRDVNGDILEDPDNRGHITDQYGKILIDQPITYSWYGESYPDITWDEHYIAIMVTNPDYSNGNLIDWKIYDMDLQFVAEIKEAVPMYDDPRILEYFSTYWEYVEYVDPFHEMRVDPDTKENVIYTLQGEEVYRTYGSLGVINRTEDGGAYWYDSKGILLVLRRNEPAVKAACERRSYKSFPNCFQVEQGNYLCVYDIDGNLLARMQINGQGDE